MKKNTYKKIAKDITKEILSINEKLNKIKQLNSAHIIRAKKNEEEISS